MLGMMRTGSPIRQQVAEFVRRRAPLSLLRAAGESESGIDDALWGEIADAGWFQTIVPEPLGGIGLGLGDLLTLFYEVGRNPVPGPLLDAVVISGLLSEAAGRDLSEGRRRIVLADPAAVPALGQGVRFDGYRLDGHVSLVRFPAASDRLAVVLGDGTDGIALVSPRAEGVAIGGPTTLDATTRVAEVAFSAVPVDAADIVVTSGDSAEVVSRLRAAIRMAMAAETAGACHALLEMTAAYVGTREQFGRAIGSFQGVQQLVAEMFEGVSRLCSMLDAVAADADSAGVAQLHQIAMRLSAAAAMTGRPTAELALQLHGGIGYTSEHDLSLFYRRVLALESQYGDRRARALAIGRSLVDARAPGVAS